MTSESQALLPLRGDLSRDSNLITLLVGGNDPPTDFKGDFLWIRTGKGAADRREWSPVKDRTIHVVPVAAPVEPDYLLMLAWYCLMAGSHGVGLELKGEKVFFEGYQAQTPGMAALLAALEPEWPPKQNRPTATNNCTDLANAARLFDLAAADYLAVAGTWHEWSGSHWKEAPEAITRPAAGLGAVVKREAEVATSDKHAAALWGWARRSEMLGGMLAASRILAGFHKIEAESCNQNDMLLPVANCTIDLKTGKPLPPKRNNFFTQASAVEFNPNATCPTWERFLSQTFDGDRELIEFVQRCAGYSLTGSQREQCFFLLVGAGRNGKSTLVSILEQLLGGFAATLSPETLTQAGQSNPEGPRPEIAGLCGKRLAVTSESGTSCQLAEGLLKRLTGEDTLSARVLYGQPVQFINSSKIWFCTNHEPRIAGSDLGIWSRIRVIPFENTIQPGREDKTLPNRLTGELPGILNWALRGCLAWQESGLKPPESVKERTELYRQDIDHFARFLAERCSLAASNTVKAKFFSEAFNGWLLDQGEVKETQHAIGARIRSTPGLSVHKRNQGYFYHGIALKTETM